MREPVPYRDDDVLNPETRHEHSDVPLRPLWWAIAIFVVFAAVSHATLWVLYKAFVTSEREAAEAPQSAVARPADAGVPKNQPLLQPFPKAGTAGTPMPPYRNTPVTDLHDMRAAEDATLGNYGWVDKEHGVVHIPIEVAKERAVAMLQNARPVATPPASPAPVAVTQTSGGSAQ